MSSLPSARLAALVLASSLTLNAVLVSCGNEPTAPGGPETATILNKLAEVTARLDSIERKLDRHGDSLTQRIDTLEAHMTLAVGGENALPALQASQVDSILSLASFIARDAVSGGWELCGGVKLAAEANGKTGSEAEVKARGSVGAWAGFGGFAGADLDGKLGYEFQLGIQGEFGAGGCVPLFPDTPPARVDQRARMARLTANDLRSTLTAMGNQVGLTDAKVTAALGAVGTVLQSPGSLNVQDAITALPLPPSLANKLSNPIAAVSNNLSSRIGDATTMLCTANWGSQVSPALSTACARISSGSTDLGGLFQVIDEFPAVQTALSAVSNTVDVVCTKVNSIGVKSLTIPNPLSIGPTNLFGPERLFPFYTSMSC